MLANSVIFQVAYQIVLLFSFATRSIPLTLLYLIMSGALIYDSRKLYTQMTFFTKLLMGSFIAVYVGMSAINGLRYLPSFAFLFLGVNTLLCVVPLMANKEVFMKASGITLYGFQTFSLIICAVIGFENFPWENPLEKVIPGASANGITSYTVILQVNYSICRFVQRTKPPLLSIFLTITIAFMGYGRGSIVSGVLLLLTTAGMHFWIGNKAKMGIGILAFVLLLGGTYFSYQKEIDFFFVSKTKFSAAGIKSSHRDYMIKDYLEKMNTENILRGATYDDTSIVTYYHNNPHNSFLRAHSIFGLPYLIVILIFPLIGFFFFENKISGIFALVGWAILALRCYTEPNLFPSTMDFYYFSLVLFPLAVFTHKNESSEPNESKVITQAQ